MYRSSLLLVIISLAAAVSAGRSSHSDDEEDTTTHTKCADWDETRKGMIMAGKEGYAAW
jgi:hypothetical protein